MTTQILVIDDSATMRKLVEIAFRGSDTKIDFAGTGAEGLARATAAPPDVILLDFMLPDMKGLDVCTRLAQQAHTSQVGVVVMSGKPEVADLFRDAPNVVAFLPKPFTAELVQARLLAALRHGDHASSRNNTTRLRSFALADEPTGADRPSEVRATAKGSSWSESHGEAKLAAPTLELQGSLVAVSLYDVLKLVCASGRTGVVRLSSGENIYLQTGNIAMCTTTRPTDEFDQLVIRGGRDLDGALATARTYQYQTGKPAVVTLAESGFEIEVDVAAALKAHGYRLLTAAIATRVGQFVWQEQRLPSYVESFGRPISLTAAALDHARGQARSGGGDAEVLDHVYQRTARFTDAINGLRLTALERAILAAIDGVATVRQVSERTKVAMRQVVATITHLAAVELIVRADAASAMGAGRSLPPIVVHDLDAEFVGQLRSLVARRPMALPVLEVADAADLDATVSRAKPQIILIGSDTRSLPPELRALAKLTSATMVAVLEVGDANTAADTLALGYDAVLFKPLHITELERLLAL
jgi:CheY-like chemotaxis protein